jgi:hypothetical protein
MALKLNFQIIKKLKTFYIAIVHVKKQRFLQNEKGN